MNNLWDTFFFCSHKRKRLNTPRRLLIVRQKKAGGPEKNTATDKRVKSDTATSVTVEKVCRMKKLTMNFPLMLFPYLSHPHPVSVLHFPHKKWRTFLFLSVTTTPPSFECPFLRLCDAHKSQFRRRRSSRRGRRDVISMRFALDHQGKWFPFGSIPFDTATTNRNHWQSAYHLNVNAIWRLNDEPDSMVVQSVSDLILGDSALNVFPESS